MHKRTLFFALALVLVLVAFTTAAYAGDGSSSGWTDFWNGVGSFLHNAMPWNWGKSA